MKAQILNMTSLSSFSDPAYDYMQQVMIPESWKAELFLGDFLHLSIVADIIMFPVFRATLQALSSADVNMSNHNILHNPLGGSYPILQQQILVANLNN